MGIRAIKGKTLGYPNETAVNQKAHMELLQQELLRWYAEHGRHFSWRDPRASVYQRVVVEILLKQTRAPAVERIWSAFFASFPEWAALAEAHTSEIEAVIRPLGLWRQRAEALRSLASIMRSREFSTEPDELHALPGVGDYVASAILLFAHQQRRPLLDVNMARVLERLFGTRRQADIRRDKALRALATSLVDHQECATLNWAVLDLGAVVCAARTTSCARCPLEHLCEKRPSYEDRRREVASNRLPT
jgi:A/G-specific adenine glycosylase